MIVMDIPYTPVGGPFNSGRDLWPRQRVDFSFQWDVALFGVAGTVFAGATNVLCVLNPVLDGEGQPRLALAADWGASPYAAAVGSAGGEIGLTFRF